MNLRFRSHHAYQEGLDAALRGDPIDLVPYQLGSWAWTCWIHGWEAGYTGSHPLTWSDYMGILALLAIAVWIITF